MSLSRGLLTRRSGASAIMSEWAQEGIEVDHCPNCNRFHGMHHLRDCPRREGFVREDGKPCLFCKAKPGQQHKKYQGEPCPNWF